MSGFGSSALQAKNGFVSVGTVSSELEQRHNSKANVKNLNDLKGRLAEREPAHRPSSASDPKSARAKPRPQI
jgi:hypothetical protein